MSTDNTREGIEELEMVAFVEIDGVAVGLFKYSEGVSLTVSGSKEYVKDIPLQQELQKAREEERERILRSVNDKEKQEQILANLLLRIAGVGINFEIADSDLLTDYVVFETRSLDRNSTLYRVERNRNLDQSELDQANN